MAAGSIALVDPSAVAATPPRSCATTATYTVVAGDGWSSIALAAGVSTTALLTSNSANATAPLYPGDKLCLPTDATAKPSTPTANACASKRTVTAGASWYAISRSSGVPLDALYAANKARSSTVLHPGQILCVPGVGFGGRLQSMLFHVAPIRGACRFANSWMAPRGGRYHVGVDLISPTGTPVLAVADGTLTRQTKRSSVSGDAWWLTTSNGTYFFYAHMSAFATGLSIGSKVHAGDVIGYVGSTGNAVSPHLHFEIHPHGGGPINPYDSIWMLGGCTYDVRYEQVPLS